MLWVTPQRIEERASVLECGSPRCTLYGSISDCVAERPEDGSRGLQPTVACAGNLRRGATPERWNASTRHPSLRDADPIRYRPWAEAHGYLRSSLRDKTEKALHDPCKEQPALASRLWRGVVVCLSLLLLSVPGSVRAAETSLAEMSIEQLLEVYVPNMLCLRHNWEASHIGMPGIISDRENKHLFLVNGNVINELTHAGALTERGHRDVDLEVLKDLGIISRRQTATIGLASSLPSGNFPAAGSRHCN